MSVPEYDIVSVEALVRWRHPSVGMVSPRVFVPIAEETGLIERLTDLVLRDACRLSRQWSNLTVAVNLSPVQFREPALVERLMRIVRQEACEPARIELEITEGHPLASDGSARDAIRRLRDAGFRIALDDFGTGYSTVERLSYLKVDKLKIDQSFVRHLDKADNPMARSIVRKMIMLSKAMGVSVLAEGVETEEQREFLSDAGCQGMQGYLFSRPLPAEDLARLLRKRQEL